MYQGKVDLHLHLDGSLSEPFMRDRLRKYGLPVPDDLHKAMAPSRSAMIWRII